MSQISLVGSYDGVRLANNIIPKRNPQVAALLDTLTELRGTKTRAKLFLCKEIITLVVNQVVPGSRIEESLTQSHKGK